MWEPPSGLPDGEEPCKRDRVYGCLAVAELVLLRTGFDAPWRGRGAMHRGRVPQNTAQADQVPLKTV